jgi:hypothetical protein
MSPGISLSSTPSRSVREPADCSWAGSAVRDTGNGDLYAIYQCIWKHREALPLPAGTTGHFGAELRRFVLAQYHQGK